MSDNESRPADPAPEPAPNSSSGSDASPPESTPDSPAYSPYPAEPSSGATADGAPGYFAPPSPYPPGPYYYPPKPGTNGFAVAALVVGIVGLCLCFGFLGIIFGNVARRQIEETGQAGAGMATAGIVLGWIAVGWIALRIILVLSVGTTDYYY
ncbi:DUF4190 domain-containing protein [Glycomyces niveus]|uniref:DUF4190 domain-containing protein n=1 Tax=Glycomyces niveus TaxID=2820287 RepID=A0ABS3U337_9ACTN|nr:DUF4190 domain-containing protein [Glycomyces sp. NEAU-S30]MBO3733189.1 DUF4190 domain-containing protein [Glycomyces sp. NEAU-S30]